MTSSNDLSAGSRLRSAQWHAGDDRNAYIHRAWIRRGVPGDAFTGRPHIAIANAASDLTPCNAHLTEVAASVKLSRLAGALDGYATLGQVRWVAWRRRQHLDDRLPSSFAKVLDEVIAFADPALQTDAETHEWDPHTRGWH